MPTKKLIGSLAIAGALVGGGVAGALLGTPTISGAQTAGATASQAPGHGDKGGAELDAAAQALGMTATELRTQLDAGKTIAQVASDRSVDVNTVIDAMTAAAQTDLRSRITDFVNNGRPHGDHGGRGPGRPGGGLKDHGPKAPDADDSTSSSSSTSS
jgi:hypothetical protein